MSGKNPFFRAIQPKTEAADRELKQPSAESDGGHADDTPSVVEDNAEDSAAAGGEFGLGATGFVSAKDRVSADVDDSSGDPAPELEDAPKDRLADGKAENFTIDGLSTQDALSAA